MKLTVTNSPFGLTIKFYCEYRVGFLVRFAFKQLCSDSVSGIARQYSFAGRGVLLPRPHDLNLWVIVAKGSHPFPSRTRKLSPSAPMVLHARVCGRVGRCPIKKEAPVMSRGFFF